MNLKTKMYDSGCDIGMAVDHIIDEIEKAQKALKDTPKKGQIMSSTSEKKFIMERVDVLKQKVDEILYPLL